MQTYQSTLHGPPLIVNQLEPSLLHAYLVEDEVVANHNKRPAYAELTVLDYCWLHKVLVKAWSPLVVRSAPSRLWGGLKHNRYCVRQLHRLGCCTTRPIQPINGTLWPERIRAYARADAFTLGHGAWYALPRATRGEHVP